MVAHAHNIQVACHKAWLTTSCFQLKWFQFFHRKKPSTLAFNTSASSNSCGVKWGPVLIFQATWKEWGCFSKHHMTEVVDNWLKTCNIDILKWQSYHFWGAFFFWKYGCMMQGFKNMERTICRNNFSGISCTRTLPSFTAVKTKPMKTFHTFSLQIHILIPDLYYKASNTFKHESLKKHQHMTTQPSLKPIRYTWRKTLERCSGAPVDVLHRPHLSNASTNIQALARRWLTWHLGSVNKKPPVTWAIKNWLVNDGISYNSPSIYPYLVG